MTMGPEPGSLLCFRPKILPASRQEGRRPYWPPPLWGGRGRRGSLHPPVCTGEEPEGLLRSCKFGGGSAMHQVRLSKLLIPLALALFSRPALAAPEALIALRCGRLLDPASGKMTEGAVVLV